MLAIAASTVLLCAQAEAQRARFGDFFELQPRQPAANSGSIIRQPGFVTAPSAVLQQPPVQRVATPPQVLGATGGNPNFIENFQNVPNFTTPSVDPFRSNNQSFPFFPRGGQAPVLDTPPNVGLPNNLPNLNVSPGNVIPNGALPNIDPRIQTNPPAFPQRPGFNPGIPNVQIPQNNGLPQLPQYNPPGGFGNPQIGVPDFGYGSPQSPNQWPYQGTGSNWLPSIDWSPVTNAWSSFQNQFLPRLLERPRIRQTYLPGRNGNELNMNDIEVATTLTYPDFLQTRQPLRITPGFIAHFWDGPDTTVHPGYDLPSRAYSSFLAFDHLTNPANQTGLEGNLTIGYYTDFDNTSSDALRLTGRFLGWSRLNQYTIGKLGVEYLDRVNVKLLPAFGVYMTPNPDLKLDLFFPRTKLSHRIPNFNDYEAWAYVGGEYGGGSWAIERIGGVKDQADINDIRAFLGVEWMGPRRVTGFMELGYVFERELLYRSDPINQLNLQDTFMLRSGLAF